MLEVANLVTTYGTIQALKGVSLAAVNGEITCILGPNGAGKTTLLYTIAGILSPRTGSVRFGGRELAGLPPHRVVASGIALVPENRLVFPNMTVRENLLAGGYGRLRSDRQGVDADLEAMYRRFPILSRRNRQAAGTLSGGEQQMVAVLNREGMTVLLVEQNARLALGIAHKAYLLEQGRVASRGTAAELSANPAVSRAYLGIKGA